MIVRFDGLCALSARGKFSFFAVTKEISMHMNITRLFPLPSFISPLSWRINLLMAFWQPRNIELEKAPKNASTALVPAA